MQLQVWGKYTQRLERLYYYIHHLSETEASPAHVSHAYSYTESYQQDVEARIDEFLRDHGELELFERKSRITRPSTPGVSQYSAKKIALVTFPTYERGKSDTPEIADFLKYFEAALKAAQCADDWYVHLVANIGGELMEYVVDYISETKTWKDARTQIEREYLGRQFRGRLAY
ncbi:hypothetical protein LPJ54_004772, partial [Coemansia sp. RSA 1824]